MQDIVSHGGEEQATDGSSVALRVSNNSESLSSQSAKEQILSTSEKKSLNNPRQVKVRPRSDESSDTVT